MINPKKVVIVGGGLSGLVAGHTLSHLGIDSLILEKSSKIGGGNNSFKDELGNIFDYGYHALDYNRSIITTKFFQKVLKDGYAKLELKRGIVLKNYLFAYNSPLQEWPKELKEFFSSYPRVDDVQGDLKRDKIAEIYGRKFTDFIFNEVLQSYPSLKWAIKNGANEEDVIGMVYPWFFPKVKREKVRHLEWEAYHDKMREKPHQYVLYPKEGGFARFIEAIVEDTNSKFCEIKTNVKDIQFSIDEKEKKFTGVICGDEFINADLFIWCASPVALLDILKVKNLDDYVMKRQEMVLGNFAFEKPVNSEYHEILVGSLEHNINRISFPGKISQKEDNLIQVEFLFPVDDFPLDKEYWKENWLHSLKKIGIIKDDNKLQSFTCISETKGFVSAKSWKYLTKQFEEKFLNLKYKNIVIPYFNLGPENINRVVPGVIYNVINSLKIIN